MELRFDGKVFVVTGAAQGIGAAIARTLSASGAMIAAIDIDSEGMGPLAGEGMDTYAADLGSREQAHAAVSSVVEKHGRIDGLVTSSGGVRGQVGRAIEVISEEDWGIIFQANVDAAMWCAQAAAPHMKKAGRGRIVTITSGAGLRPSLTGIQAYACAKHALVGLTRQLALELGPFGITVNSVAPGFVLSNPSTQRQWEAMGEDRQRTVVERINMRRLGHAQDIANAVAFLASDQANWISGQIISVDGGHQ